MYTIKAESIELTEEQLKDLAIFGGWEEKITQIENEVEVSVDNPVSYKDFITEKIGKPIWDFITDWKLKEAQEEFDLTVKNAQAALNDSRDQSLSEAKETIEVTIE